jgi:hypothetical protein
MNVELGSVIPSLVEFALPRGSGPTKLLHIPIGVSAYTFPVNRSIPKTRVNRNIIFLFQRPRNYTKVFVAIPGWERQVVSNRRKWVKTEGCDHVYPIPVPSLNELRWDMTSNHDSCWRSDGVSSILHGIYLDMRTEILESCPGTLVKNINWDGTIEPKSCKMGYVSADVVMDELTDDGSFIPMNIRKYKEVASGV